MSDLKAKPDDRSNDNDSSAEERALDRYLDAVLRGEQPDIEQLCGGDAGAAESLRKRIATFQAVVAPRSEADPHNQDSLQLDQQLKSSQQLQLENLGEYKLIEKLGEGGMGIVYLAEQTSLKRKVAIKVIRHNRLDSPAARARFEREATTLASLRHPNIVNIINFGEQAGICYLAMELVSGKALDEIIHSETGERGGGFLAQRVRWISQIARALDYAHSQGVVHRDVKPSNIRITENDSAVLVDFGLARGAGAMLVSTIEQFKGTPYYASPEQIDPKFGATGPKSDIYSLGITLYEAVTGLRPFVGESTEQVFHAILTKDATGARKLNKQLPRDLETILAAATEKDPARRYASAGAFADDLDALLDFHPIRARRAGVPARIMKWTQRNRLASITIGIAASAIFSFLVYLFYQHSKIQNEIKRDLAAAESSARSNDFDTSLAAVERVLAHAPSDARALQKKSEYTNARSEFISELALKEGREHLIRLKKFSAELQPVRRDHTSAIQEYEEKYTSRADVESLQQKQQQLQSLRRGFEEARIATAESLNRALRNATRRDPIDRLFAEYYYELWLTANEMHNNPESEVYEQKIAEHDTANEFIHRIRGDGILNITVAPGAADLYLFRFESQSEILEHGEDRLVPVPYHPERGLLFPKRSTGTPLPRADLAPGNVVLAIDRVIRDSKLWKRGIREGDIIFKIENIPFEKVNITRFIEPAGPAVAAGVQLNDFLWSIHNKTLPSPVELHEILDGVTRDGPVSVTFRRPPFAANTTNAPIDVTFMSTNNGSSAKGALGVYFPPLEKNISHGALKGLTVTIDTPSGIRELKTEELRESGLRCLQTSIPLLCSNDNCINGITQKGFILPPGSYLLLLRRDGFEDLRYPVLVRPGKRSEVPADLLPQGSTPDGFVWIPPGESLLGGDPDADGRTVGMVKTFPGFWIQRLEITEREYLQFINDPNTIQLIDSAAARGQLIYLPRENGVVSKSWKRKDSTYSASLLPDDSVRHISFDDSVAYCEWRTAKAKEKGLPLEFTLATEEEWERAARGADGRDFPWGNSFDWTFCNSSWSFPSRKQLYDAVYFPRDESPFSIMSMAGNLLEFTSTPGFRDQLYIGKGGACGSLRVEHFRAAKKYNMHHSLGIGFAGFRMVARSTVK
ncbi:MAG: protein kinase domain-containing protein [Planctomycetota bacterium]